MTMTALVQLTLPLKYHSNPRLAGRSLVAQLLYHRVQRV